MQAVNSPSDVHALSYPDFVALIAQDNSPPGGIDTISAWAQLSRIDETSRVLDLACSTGFSSRTLAKQTGCQAVGIDLSAASITRALALADEGGLSDRVSFRAGDAASLPFANDSFSHVVAGCSFGFIDQRDRALKDTARVLRPDGSLCIATFFYVRSPPVQILDRVSAVLAFRPEATWTAEFWKRFFFQSFRLETEQVHRLPTHNPLDVVESAYQTVNSDRLRSALPPPVLDAAFRRLAKDRLVLNEHRQYQAYSIQIWTRS